MSYHHKGGVGKSTTAVHVALRLLERGRRVLVIDGDSQAHSTKFFGVEAAASRRGPVEVPAHGALHVVHARYPKIRQVPGQVGADDVVIDLSADLPDASRAANSLSPDLVLVCVRQDSGALRDIEDVIATLVRETDADVRVVPIGVTEAEIRAAMPRIPPELYAVTPPVSYVREEAERSYEEHRAIWTYAGCEGMNAEYDALIA